MIMKRLKRDHDTPTPCPQSKPDPSPWCSAGPSTKCTTECSHNEPVTGEATTRLKRGRATETRHVKETAQHRQPRDFVLAAPKPAHHHGTIFPWVTYTTKRRYPVQYQESASIGNRDGRAIQELICLKAAHVCKQHDTHNLKRS